MLPLSVAVISILAGRLVLGHLAVEFVDLLLTQVEKQMHKEAWANRLRDQKPVPAPPKEDWIKSGKTSLWDERLAGMNGEKPSWDEEDTQTKEEEKAQKIFSQVRPNVRGHQW